MASMTSISQATLFLSADRANSWLGDALSSIQNQNNAGGLLGMLQHSGGDGSISSFLGSSATTASQFALISQNSVTNTSSLVAQIAAQNAQQTNAQQLQDAIDALSASKQMVQSQNVLDPTIFFADGSTLDTNSHILIRSDGTQLETTTGAKVIDTSSMIQMANGAYLDTANNILTMPDGTEIDTVTGLKISVTA
ncbi:MAG: hypothetical protein WBM16_03575 [Pseudolabrys sp.]